MTRIKVKKIIDGDTFKDDKDKFYRLAGVNTPEKKKRGYKKAKKVLTKLIEGEELIIKIEGKSYRRNVIKARKSGEKRTINEKMRRKGYK